MHDPSYQNLVEVYSGPRQLRGVPLAGARWPTTPTATGMVCPEPTAGLPAVLLARRGDHPRALRRRRLRRGLRGARRDRPRQLPGRPASSAGRRCPASRSRTGSDCGQCRDCYNASYDYRPRGSSQYALAISSFDDAGAPRRFRFGFIGSSDNHIRPARDRLQGARPSRHRRRRPAPWTRPGGNGSATLPARPTARVPRGPEQFEHLGPVPSQQAYAERQSSRSS